MDSYAYDGAGRLIQATQGNTAYQYQYDEVGNRTQSLQTTQKAANDDPSDQANNQDNQSQNASNQQNEQSAQTPAKSAEDIKLSNLDIAEEGQGNRLTAIDGNTIDYNPEGSALDQWTDKGHLEYEYNSRQRPIKLYVDGKLKAEYAYNGFGERIKKTVYNKDQKNQSDTTYYLYEGQAIVAEANAQGDVTDQYVYHTNQPLVKLENAKAYYLLTDHLGTPKQAVDEKQNTVWEADYSPFGKADIQTASIELNLRFPGQYEDQESGTHYNYYRDYNPETGRYITSDPIGLQGGINTYAYVASDPLSNIDPLGLFSLVIGIEANNPNAFTNGVHDIFEDTGHVFLYLTNDNGEILESLSFGPVGGLDPSDESQIFNGVEGTSDFPIGELSHLFEFDTNIIQHNAILNKIRAFRAINPRYRPFGNITCGGVAVGLINDFLLGLDIPDGESPVNIRREVRFLSDENGVTNFEFVNPYALLRDLIEEGHEFTIADPSSFTELRDLGLDFNGNGQTDTVPVIQNGAISPTHDTNGNGNADDDGDGISDRNDAFPLDPNESVDTDGDGVGDNSDLFPNDANESSDADGDGVGDNSDAFPLDSLETEDTDSDGIGDNSDAFPKDSSESIDTDSDGVGDNADAFPTDPSESKDTDGDGLGDNSDSFPKEANENSDADSTGTEN